MSLELEALKARVQSLEKERSFSRRLALGVVVTLTLSLSTVAVGQVTNLLPCNPARSTSLFCFTANEPARAEEVNHNVEQLAVWANRVAPDGTNRLLVNGAHVARVAAADSATNATAATTANNALAVNGVKLFSKAGNNGTVTCRNFCSNNGGAWGRFGYCVGAVHEPNAAISVNCESVPGISILCYCVEP